MLIDFLSVRKKCHLIQKIINRSILFFVYYCNSFLSHYIFYRHYNWTEMRLTVAVLYKILVTDN